jgi:hypothetical protein
VSTLAAQAPATSAFASNAAETQLTKIRAFCGNILISGKIFQRAPSHEKFLLYS